MDCCEIALANSRLALYIALGGFGTISLLLLMFFGYNLTLDKRTAKLEKKNGAEQHQIDELRKEVERLKNQNGMSALPKEKNPS